jgi:2-iminobutanoate/2-iminopropanoate deaminase
MSQQINTSRYKRIGNTVYTNGITGKPGDVPTQIRNVMDKLRTVLEEAGTSLAHVVKVNVYLSDLSYRERYLNSIWNEYFPKDAPVRTTVGVTLGQDVFVEIEMVAEVP